MKFEMKVWFNEFRFFSSFLIILSRSYVTSRISNIIFYVPTYMLIHINNKVIFKTNLFYFTDNMDVIK